MDASIKGRVEEVVGGELLSPQFHGPEDAFEGKEVGGRTRAKG